MRIAHVNFKVATENRTQVLAALVQEARDVRAMDGCIAFIPFLNPLDDCGLGVVHEWESGKYMARYLGSEQFKRFGQTVRPFMIAPPVSNRFDATLIESVA